MASYRSILPGSKLGKAFLKNNNCQIVPFLKGLLHGMGN